MSAHPIFQKILEGFAPPTSKSDAQREMDRAMGPRENPAHPMFTNHNCAECGSGKRPCKRGNPSQCEFPYARND